MLDQFGPFVFPLEELSGEGLEVIEFPAFDLEENELRASILNRPGWRPVVIEASATDQQIPTVSTTTSCYSDLEFEPLTREAVKTYAVQAVLTNGLGEDTSLSIALTSLLGWKLQIDLTEGTFSVVSPEGEVHQWEDLHEIRGIMDEAAKVREVLKSETIENPENLRKLKHLQIWVGKEVIAKQFPKAAEQLNSFDTLSLRTPLSKEDLTAAWRRCRGSIADSETIESAIEAIDNCLDGLKKATLSGLDLRAVENLFLLGKGNFCRPEDAKKVLGKARRELHGMSLITKRFLNTGKKRGSDLIDPHLVVTQQNAKTLSQMIRLPVCDMGDHYQISLEDGSISLSKNTISNLLRRHDSVKRFQLRSNLNDPIAKKIGYKMELFENLAPGCFLPRETSGWRALEPTLQDIAKELLPFASSWEPAWRLITGRGTSKDLQALPIFWTSFQECNVTFGISEGKLHLLFLNSKGTGGMYLDHKKTLSLLRGVILAECFARFFPRNSRNPEKDLELLKDRTCRWNLSRPQTQKLLRDMKADPQDPWLCQELIRGWDPTKAVAQKSGSAEVTWLGFASGPVYLGRGNDRGFIGGRHFFCTEASRYIQERSLAWRMKDLSQEVLLGVAAIASMPSLKDEPFQFQIDEVDYELAWISEDESSLKVGRQSEPLLFDPKVLLGTIQRLFPSFGLTVYNRERSSEFWDSFVDGKLLPPSWIKDRLNVENVSVKIRSEFFTPQPSDTAFDKFLLDRKQNPNALAELKEAYDGFLATGTLPQDWPACKSARFYLERAITRAAAAAVDCKLSIESPFAQNGVTVRLKKNATGGFRGIVEIDGRPIGMLSKKKVKTTRKHKHRFP